MTLGSRCTRLIGGRGEGGSDGSGLGRGRAQWPVSHLVSFHGISLTEDLRPCANEILSPALTEVFLLSGTVPGKDFYNLFYLFFFF